MVIIQTINNTNANADLGTSLHSLIEIEGFRFTASFAVVRFLYVSPHCNQRMSEEISNFHWSAGFIIFIKSRLYISIKVLNSDFMQYFCSIVIWNRFLWMQCNREVHCPDIIRLWSLLLNFSRRGLVQLRCRISMFKVFPGQIVQARSKFPDDNRI